MRGFEYTMAARPTTYNGVNFRSRLEARWAAFFDLCEMKWEYEPIDLEGWTPDFYVCGWLMEVKPVTFDHLPLCNITLEFVLRYGCRMKLVNGRRVCADDKFKDDDPCREVVSRDPAGYSEDYISRITKWLDHGWEGSASPGLLGNGPFQHPETEAGDAFYEVGNAFYGIHFHKGVDWWDGSGALPWDYARAEALWKEAGNLTQKRYRK